MEHHRETGQFLLNCRRVLPSQLFHMLLPSCPHLVRVKHSGWNLPPPLGCLPGGPLPLRFTHPDWLQPLLSTLSTFSKSWLCSVQCLVKHCYLLFLFKKFMYFWLCWISVACSTRTSLVLLHGMWDLPGPGIKSMSYVLQGRFLITGPWGKPWFAFKNKRF